LNRALALNPDAVLALARVLALVLPACLAQACAAEAPEREGEEAQFRGCEAAGWCRFWIAPQLLRVRPEGVSRPLHDPETSIALRNRFNALLANMIHQDKHIVLSGLHPLGDGTFAATVTVNGADIALDPTVVDLQQRAGSARR
jgi:hypothetical protein